MTRYNTGNPVGSNSPLDLYDNAENLDAGINGAALTWRDRLGVTRRSWSGIEADFQQFLADGSTIEFPTWAEASTAAGAGQIPLNRQVAVIGDAGTHTDPVSGEVVPNSGRYVMVAGGLQWRAPDVLSRKADIADLDVVRDATDEVDARTQDIARGSAGNTGGLALTFALVDPDGNAIAGIDTANNLQVLGLTGKDFHVDAYTQGDWDFALTDAAGYVIAGIRDGVWQAASDARQLDYLDQRNREFSASVRSTAVRSVQQPSADFNVVLNYGQSLAEGNETWPSLSKVSTPGTLMLGDNVDQSATSGSYTPIGSSTLNPLVAHTRVGTNNLTDAQEAGLLPGDQAIGEPPVAALASTLKADMNRRLVVEDDGRKVVALNPAVGGRTIEQLSKGATANIYPLVTDGLSKAKAQTGASTVCVPLVSFAQGEYNYADVNSTSPTTDRAPYAQLLDTLFDNIAADVKASTGQALAPLFLTYQTGASWTRDVSLTGVVGLSIGMAQLDVALSRRDAAMIGPVYQYPDKGGHLDSNGSRWFGCMYAKVARKILLEGQGWQPVRPLQAEQDGRSILLHYHVPVPPLRFSSPVVGATLAVYADRGFRVTTADGATDIPISSVELVRGTIIRLSLATEPPAGALIWYADKTVHNGNGMVCDSDREVAAFDYEFVPERGMYPSANIAAFVGKPYPLQNWSIAFCIPLNYSEFQA